MIGVLPVAVLAFPAGTAYAEPVNCDQHKDAAPNSPESAARVRCASDQTWDDLYEANDRRDNEMQANPNMTPDRREELRKDDEIDRHVGEKQREIDSMRREQTGLAEPPDPSMY